jgi:hypothetical protein
MREIDSLIMSTLYTLNNNDTTLSHKLNLVEEALGVAFKIGVATNFDGQPKDQIIQILKETLESLSETCPIAREALVKVKELVEE